MAIYTAKYGGDWSNHYTSGSVIYTNIYSVASTSGSVMPPKEEPETPEQWLRKRVKEICDLAKL